MKINNLVASLPRRIDSTSVLTWCYSVLLCLIILNLVACGGSSADGEQTKDGIVIVGLTDAEGDFLNYTVDVTSLTLTKANGSIVETLPLTTRVDFSQYTDLTEFLTAATVPLGAYTHATMKLNYSNADIWVENAVGESVKVENIQDSQGAPITEFEVSVRLEGQNKLVVAPGVPAHMTLDFDLNASNQVTFDDQGVPTQVVEPFLLADLQLQRPKIHRLRGPLARVNVEEQRFSIIIRPFFHRQSDDRRFGTLSVVTNEETVFDIDNEPYQGQAGLQALDELTAFSATVVIGDLKFNPRRFEAREVIAGESVPGGSLDAVRGTIMSRDGNLLRVKGATLIRAGGSVVFNDEVSVTISDTTLVRKQFSSVEHTINEISVGQRVSISGVLDDSNQGQLALDASAGVVRMKLTGLRGTSVAAEDILDGSPYFVMALQAINGRQVGGFDFSGTGVDANSDANPDQYEVDQGALLVDEIGANQPVKVRGFVKEFGGAPADFEALTIVDVANAKAVLMTTWEPANVNAINRIAEQSMSLNLDGVGHFHHINRSGVLTDLSDLDGAPLIQSADSGEGVFVLIHLQSRQLFTQFSDFLDELESRMNAGSSVKKLVTTGQFEDQTITMTTNYMTVTIQ